MKTDAAAIIVAGGQGKRFGGKTRKQYLTLNGRPVLRWSMQAFDQSPSIGLIVIAVPQDDLGKTRILISRWKIKTPLFVVAGGKTRAESVVRGLAAVPSEFRWVAIHDAVRPMVTPSLVEKVLTEARSHRAAIAACPSRDTVKWTSNGNTIQRTLPRENVWLAQTPQAFERTLLERAHKTGRRGNSVTDDSMLVERLGIRVKMVNSPPENLKVTLPIDLKIAQVLMARRSAS